MFASFQFDWNFILSVTTDPIFYLSQPFGPLLLLFKLLNFSVLSFHFT
jgi:hypothetical protein